MEKMTINVDDGAKYGYRLLAAQKGYSSLSAFARDVFDAAQVAMRENGTTFEEAFAFFRRQSVDDIGEESEQ